MSFFILRPDAHKPVAYRNMTPVSGRDFLRSVDCMRVELDKRPERTWGLFMEDSYAFAVSLCALLVSERVTVVLPNAQRGFLESIRGYFDGILTDREDILPSLPQLSCAESAPSFLPSGRGELALPNGEVALFTSGSTGEPKMISKRFSQLLNESRVLEQLWGGRLGDSVILSTVTHQHIYGLLFRIIWPLTAGRCFSTDTLKNTESFIDYAAHLSRITLVSSPAYLRRMTEGVDLRHVAPHVTMVFSSGGPLSNEAAMQIRKELGSEVREVYGSTETGGIAHRSQVEAKVDAPWIPLPSVLVKSEPESGCLMVASPFEGSGQWYTTADTVVFLEEGTFRLMGRSDNIVKVEEKRLSLTELEKRLSSLDLVCEAGATVQENYRTSVVVALVLSDQGQIYVREHGKWQLQRHLRDYLLQYFEPVLLPRKWRFVDSLPLNPQGKVLRRELLALFELPLDEAIRTPQIRKVSISERTATLSLFIPANLLYFSGHFPGQPILPGVVQIDWALLFARKYLRVSEGFRSMEAVKFHTFITPNATVQLELQYEGPKETLYFTYTCEGNSCSSGRIILGARK